MKTLITSLMLILLLGFIGCDNSNIVLTKDNFINLRGIIDPANADKVIREYKALRKLNAKKTIYLVIESPGGYIGQGNRIIAVLGKDKNVKTISIYAASMASAIVEALPGERLSIPNATFMFHRGMFVRTVKELIGLETNNSKRLHLTLNEYRMKVVKQWDINGVELLRNKIVDRFVSISCDKSLDKLSEPYKLVDPMFGRVMEVKLSKCPLVVSPL